MRQRFVRLAGATSIMLLATSGVAHGDVLEPAAGNVSVEADSRGVAKFVLNSTDPDDPVTGCNANGPVKPTVYVTSSNDELVAIDEPGYMEIGNCGGEGGSIGFSVSPAAPIGTVVTITAQAPDGTSTSPNGKVDVLKDKKSVVDTFYPTYQDGSFTVTVVAPADTTPPVVDATITGTMGSNDWYTADVTVSWTVADAESDISSTEGCDEATITDDQQSTDYTCTATSEGGTASKTVSIKRDATVPDVALIDGPQDEAGYYYGFVPAAPGCTASDATSGLDGGCAVSGYMAAVGVHTVSASASDNAGNAAVSSATYAVKAWTAKGFYAPVDKGVHNTVKSGATVPLKFNVFAGDDELTDTAIVTARTKQITCGTGTLEDTVEVTATGGTSLRYDTTGGQFIYNWQTPAKRAGTCWTVTVGLADGSSLSADFKLK